jgi:hypothetical protein
VTDTGTRWKETAMTGLTTTPARGSTTPAAPGLGPVAAALVVAAPVTLLVSELTAPRETSDLSEAQDLAFLLGNDDRLTASWLVGLVVAGLLATAYVLVVSGLRDRGRVVGRVAGVLGVAGAVGLAGHYAISLASLDLAQHGGSAQLVATLEDGTGAVATVLPVILGANLGIVLLSTAVVRAGWAPRWMVGVGLLALVADFSPTSWNTVLHAVCATVVMAGTVIGMRRERE